MQQYLKLLKEFIAFKSVSTDPQYKDDAYACADWLITQLQKNGFTTQRIEGFGNPLIYGYYIVDPMLPTYLVYGHYDVQPADKEDGWKSDPFTLFQDAERLYARGIVDNKGQHLIHLATIFKLIEQNDLKTNIKILIEGDEETGSPHMVRFFEEYHDILQCDGAIISDGEIIGHTTPTMTQSFRGGANLTLTLTTADTDLHSGMYGNILPSASHCLVQLCSKLYDDKGLIAIPGRYDDVAAISETTRENNMKVPFNPEDLFAATGCQALVTPEGYDPVTANGLLPTIQISGLNSGYTGTGYKNIIPAIATAKMNFRFAPGQDAVGMIQRFETWVNAMVPSYCRAAIATSDPYDAISINIDHPRVDRCKALLGKVYDREVVMRHCGAAVPISGLFQKYLKCPVAVVDLGNEDCNMHGINENFRLDNIEKGLRFSELLFGTSEA